MDELFKKPVKISFEEILKKLDLTEHEYYQAIRSNLTRTDVFLRRYSLEVGINAYNKQILQLFECNMDIQFVVNEYAVASYIVNYISKTEAGLSKMLRAAVKETKEKKFMGHRKRLQHISNVLSNGSLMSAQEAAYVNLSLPFVRNSRAYVFINTSTIEKRARMTKSVAALEGLGDDDTEILLPNLMDKYADRPKALEHKCLAEFAAWYSERKNKTAKKHENENVDDGDDGSLKSDASDDEQQEESDEKNLNGSKNINGYRRRARPRYIRYVRYDLKKNESDYYREQCLLFHPWRNEQEEIENANCKELYGTSICSFHFREQRTV